jgi:hypothetical protein
MITGILARSDISMSSSSSAGVMPPTAELGQRSELVEAGEPRGHGPVGGVEVGGRVGGAEARRASAHGLSYQAGHLVDLRRRGLPLLGGVAHDVATQRAVPDVEGGVDADLAPHRFQELREALEAVDRDALERARVHALDPSEELDEPRGVAGLEGGHGEAAVAGHDRGDPVVAARRAVGLEGELRVVVGVRVDDARRHDPAGGVDHPHPLARLDEPDGGDAPIDDADVGGAARQPGAVDHCAVGDHQVIARHRGRLEHVLVSCQVTFGA